MNIKETSEMVWPIHGYNEKIRFAVKNCLKQTPWLTFDEKQIKQVVKKGYEWLHVCNKKQEETLGTIIRCTMRSLIYQGLVVQVKNVTTIKNNWQWKEGAEDPDANNTIVSSDDQIVKNADDVAKLAKHGTLNREHLKKMFRTV